MPVALRSLLELRVLLDSLRTACDSRFSAGPVSDSNKRVAERRGVRSGSAARIELFETEGSVPGEELGGGSLRSRPSNVPVNAESMAPRTDFSDT
jgi:hypothetical protein